MIGPLTTEIYLTTISPSFAFYVIISHTRISVLYHTINISSGNLIPTALQLTSMKLDRDLVLYITDSAILLVSGRFRLYKP